MLLSVRLWQRTRSQKEQECSPAEVAVFAVFIGQYSYKGGLECWSIGVLGPHPSVTPVLQHSSPPAERSPSKLRGRSSRLILSTYLAQVYLKLTPVFCN